MSHEATSWAWAQPTRSSGQRLVLLALADHASDHDDPGKPTNGMTAWPKIDTLATMTGLSYDTVRAHLVTLTEDGLVEKVARRLHGTRAGAWVFRLCVDAQSKTGDVGTVKTGDVHTVMTGHGGPVISPNIEPEELNPKNEQGLALVSASSLDEAFELFWATYGRLGPKKVARETWMKHVKAGAAHQAIQRGLEAWCAYWVTPGASSPKWPQGWLNEERWNDDPPVRHLAVTRPSLRDDGTGAIARRRQAAGSQS